MFPLPYLTLPYLRSPSALQDAGIWFVFHSASTGDSQGVVPETRAELTPLGIFYNNRVHSNFKVPPVSYYYFFIAFLLLNIYKT